VSTGVGHNWLKIVSRGRPC